MQHFHQGLVLKEQETIGNHRKTPVFHGENHGKTGADVPFNQSSEWNHVKYDFSHLEITDPSDVSGRTCHIGKYLVGGLEHVSILNIFQRGRSSTNQILCETQV